MFYEIFGLDTEALRQLINETLHNLNIKLTLRLLHWPVPCWIAFKPSGSRWAVFGWYTAYARFKCSFIKVRLWEWLSASCCGFSETQKNTNLTPSVVFSVAWRAFILMRWEETREQPRAHLFDTLSRASCGFINSMKDPGVSKQRFLLRAEVLLSSEISSRSTFSIKNPTIMRIFLWLSHSLWWRGFDVASCAVSAFECDKIISNKNRMLVANQPAWRLLSSSQTKGRTSLNRSDI